MIFNGTRRIKKPIVNGQEARMLVRCGRQVWPCRGVDPLPSLEYRMVEETDGLWFEVGFRSPEELDGNAAAGWTDPRGYCVMELQQTVDLATWAMGKFVDCATTAIDNGDGTWDYWARSIVPNHWEEVMVDLTAATDLYGKSITGMTVMQTAVTLPNFPYAMPADAAQLETDLIAEGFTGATVTVTSGALLATARNHTVAGALRLDITQSGGSVTDVAFHGSSISLPSYPYAMPADQADLQADLRTAGHTGAVVMLHDDTWEIVLPDVDATGVIRDFSVEIDPGDPFPYWDGFGTYQGLAPANSITGTSGNVRTPGGDPLDEAGKQFARMRITRGTRVLP